MERQAKIVYCVLASALLMLLGAFGPWAKVFGFSVSGTDGSNDGWIVVVVAVVGAGLFLWRRGTRYAGLWPVLAGAAGSAVTIYDRQNLSSAGDGELAEGLVQVGWGLNLAMLASISFSIAGVVWIRAWTSDASPAPSPAPEVPDVDV
jgi:hypothetical protein